MRLWGRRLMLCVAFLGSEGSFHFNIRARAGLWSNYLHFNLGLRPPRRGFSDVIYKRPPLYIAPDGDADRAPFRHDENACAPLKWLPFILRRMNFLKWSLYQRSDAHTCIDSGGWPLKDPAASGATFKWVSTKTLEAILYFSWRWSGDKRADSSLLIRKIAPESFGKSLIISVVALPSYCFF
jgi:hypothetical protein